jgi:uncharacterized protein HemX
VLIACTLGLSGVTRHGAAWTFAASYAETTTAATDTAIGHEMYPRTHPPAVTPTHSPPANQTPASGAAGGRRGGGHKSRMLSHLFTLILLAGAAAGGYSFWYIRRLQKTLPLLEDRVSSQARQLAELRDILQDPERMQS